jgi:hypothetical protein
MIKKVVSLEFLAGGTLLLLYGINESKSLNSDISRFFTGSANDKAIWMLVGGTIGIVLGMMGLLHESGRSKRCLEPGYDKNIDR